ncbi:putative heavy metal-associated isoprenylated plant protein 19 [Cocos nucifera]|uniref:Putative heavy metal-associated isoprenylated plant protein 19 n=1 Tax=Cocos nucifera TaxID=13894 RepID=A0A8K0HTW1_COCNU|nr:putative heavy metal-associated isoprenylated plant protein 19 [Cocos nucifera]
MKVSQAIVLELKVYMHCKACEKLVFNTLRKFKGVETVNVDMNGDKAIVTGRIEPEKILKKLRKKTGKRVEIIKKNDDNVGGNKDETFLPSGDCNMETRDGGVVSSGNFVENMAIVLELKVYMHCKACEKLVFNTLRKFKGVETVNVDMNGDKAIVTGRIEPEKILKKLRKKTGKRVEIIKKNDDNVGGNKDETFLPSGDCNMETRDGGVVSSGNFVENMCQPAKPRGRPRKKLNLLRHMKRVETVNVDMNGDKAIVTGRIEPEKILKKLRKKTGKRVEIIKKNDDNVGGNKDETFLPSGDCNMETRDGGVVSSGNFVENMVVDFDMFSDENPNACSII